MPTAPCEASARPELRDRHISGDLVPEAALLPRRRRDRRAAKAARRKDSHYCKSHGNAILRVPLLFYNAVYPPLAFISFMPFPP